MFSNLIFLILALLLISISPDLAVPVIESPLNAFLIGLMGYGCLLLILYAQARLKNKMPYFIRRRHVDMVHLELLIFLSFLLITFGAQRFFSETLPWGQWQIVPTVFSLLLYFGGLAFYHYFSFDQTRQLSSSTTKNAREHTSFQLRIIIPFVLPFLVFTLCIDILNQLPPSYLEWNWLNLMITLTLFTLLTIVFFPYFLQKIWQCRSLENKELEKKLEIICAKAHFKHAGIKTWTILDDSLTAAIVGVLPQLRYIIFTKKILRQFPENSLEAILAHEIGHSYHKHLWIYPFIFFGMMVFLAMAGAFIVNPLLNRVLLNNSLIAMELISFLILAIYALLMVGYFRVVFGYFSRLFERQADLHVFRLGLSPYAMIKALDMIGIANGYSHSDPNWHHHSLKDRIDFLLKCIDDPKFIKFHHKKTKLSLILYFAMLALCLLALFIFWV